MPSPFPGMNPYLEQPGTWHDFHEQFCVVCRTLLVPRLVPGYFARLEEHLYIHELPAEERRFLGRADVSITQHHRSGSADAITSTISAPVIGHIDIGVDVESESFIEIRDRDSRRLVTVIEFLSPSNKQPGADREQYLGKRRQLIKSHVHFVEVDLLRGGPRMPVRDLPPCDFYVMVSRYENRPDVQLWPIQLRDPLPEIPVPLSGPDEAATLDLQAALQNSYDSAGYVDYIYEGTPDPPLAEADAAWASEILNQAGIPT